MCAALLTGGRANAGRCQEAGAGLLGDHQQGEDVRRRLAFALVAPRFEAVIGTQNMNRPRQDCQGLQIGQLVRSSDVRGPRSVFAARPRTILHDFTEAGQAFAST